MLTRIKPLLPNSNKKNFKLCNKCSSNNSYQECMVKLKIEILEWLEVNLQIKGKDNNKNVVSSIR